MEERDLIVAVLAAQAGLATPSEVLSAAAAGLVDSTSESLLTRLERTGVLTQQRRELLETLAEQALRARKGDVNAVLASLEETPALLRTLVSATGAALLAGDGEFGPREAVPLERPGQYTRLQELGRGSQSIVRAARDEFVGREVALKELTASSSNGAEGVPTVAAQVRFLREARLVAGLDHPGIVAVHEVARREDGTLFCVQKLIRGETLQMRLARCGTLSDRLGLVRHVVDASQAVGFAHARRIIHRDLKPSNVMVGEYGETVVVDWGLAKHREEPEEAVPLLPLSPEPGVTVEGTALGTPAYMSPEQARGDLVAIDARSDVFSLGAILYQVLTGRPPFEGATPEHILENVRAGRFSPVRALAPEAPRELAAIAERALRSDPARRYADGEELAREISAYLSGGRVDAYRYGLWELLRRFASAHRALLSGISIAVVALAVSGIMSAVRLRETRVDLARSFRDRAYRAEQEGDWAAAAVYFAASRAQHDTAEARWGLADASARSPEQVVSLRTGPRGLADVGVLPDGRVVVVGNPLDRVEVRELGTGKSLWTRVTAPAATVALLPGGVLRVEDPEGWTFFDAATGHESLRWPRSEGFPCAGPFPPAAAIADGELRARGEGEPPRVLATDAFSGAVCAVSEDHRQVIYSDRSGVVRLLSLDDGREIVRRPREPSRGFLFSHHGAVVLRQDRLEVLGGADGDFTIDLRDADPGISGTAFEVRGSAVSPDGEDLVLVGRRGGAAAVVNLRSRGIRGILHYPPGWPRLAFSHDGKRIFAAGLGNESELRGWQLPADGFPKTPRWWTEGMLSESGRTAVLYSVVTHRYELFEVGGAVSARGVHPLGLWNRLVGDGPAVAFVGIGASTAVIHDLANDRTLWEHACPACRDISVSRDGSRLAQVGANGVEVWDTRSNRLLFQESRRIGPPTGEECTLSRDGRQLAWAARDTVVIRNLDTGHEVSFPLDGRVDGIGFSPDGSGLLMVTTASVVLWNPAAGRAAWRVPSGTTEHARLFWSEERRSVLLSYGYKTNEVLDIATGERLALFRSPSRAITPLVGELYTPDLRVKSVTAVKTWDLFPVPQPHEAPANESLAGVLARTGLALQGVEVVAGP